MAVRLEVEFVDRLHSIIRETLATIERLAVPADMVPAFPSDFARTEVFRPTSSKVIAVILPTPELHAWAMAVSRAAAEHLARTSATHRERCAVDRAG